MNTIEDETNEYVQTLMDDIFIMMGFARESGIEIPESLSAGIAYLMNKENFENDNLIHTNQKNYKSEIETN